MRSAAVWSSRRGDLFDYVAWCRQVGGIIRRAPPSQSWQSPVGPLAHGYAGPIPRSHSIAATWPPEAYQSLIPPRLVHSSEPPQSWEILDLELAVADDSQNPENIALSVHSGDEDLPIAAFSCFAPERAFFPPQGQTSSEWIIEFKEGWLPSRVPVSEYFARYPPKILLETGEVVQGQRVSRPAPVSLVLPAGTWIRGNWQNADITNETTHREGGPLTVHEATLAMIESDWGHDTIIVLDHGSGEIADLIAVSPLPFLDHPGRIGLFHCKASETHQPSLRVHDLYEVVGQSLKSFDWPGSRDFFAELIRRLDRGRASLALGSRDDLEALAPKPHRAFRFQVHLVQPGLSIAEASSPRDDARLALLASAYQWFQETAVDFFIVGS